MREDVHALLERLVELLFHHQRTERQDGVGNCFGTDQHVWFEVVLFAGEHGSGSAESIDGLIGNQDDVVLVTDFANALEITLVAGERTSRVLNRFKEESRYGVWVFHKDHFLNAVRCPKAELFFVGEIILGAVPVGVWYAEGAWNQWLESFLHVGDTGQA